VIVEVDGLDKYRDDNVRKEEKIRETRLEKLGYCVIRVTWDDVVRHWVDTAALIRKKIRERAPHLPP
jgi:very-short-patch-repair endonuclease